MMLAEEVMELVLRGRKPTYKENGEPAVDAFLSPVSWLREREKHSAIFAGVRVKYSACRRGDLAGFDTPHLPEWLYSSFLATTTSPPLPSDSKTAGGTLISLVLRQFDIGVEL